MDGAQGYPKQSEDVRHVDAKHLVRSFFHKRRASEEIRSTRGRKVPIQEGKATGVRKRLPKKLCDKGRAGRDERRPFVQGGKRRRTAPSTGVHPERQSSPGISPVRRTSSYGSKDEGDEA